MQQQMFTAMDSKMKLIEGVTSNRKTLVDKYITKGNELRIWTDSLTEEEETEIELDSFEFLLSQFLDIGLVLAYKYTTNLKMEDQISTYDGIRLTDEAIFKMHRLQTLWYDKLLTTEAKNSKESTFQLACFLRFVGSAIMGGLNPTIICRTRFDQLVRLVSIPKVNQSDRDQDLSMNIIEDKFETLSHLNGELKIPDVLARWIGSGEEKVLYKNTSDIRKKIFLKKIYLTEGIYEVITAERAKMKGETTQTPIRKITDRTSSPKLTISNKRKEQQDEEDITDPRDPRYVKPRKNLKK
jgi:hypothetical protein